MTNQNAAALSVPSNLDAENAVLGAILLEEGAYLGRLSGLEATDFYTDSHRAIYRAMWDLVERGEPTDIITLSEELRRTDQLEFVGGPAALALLVEQASIASHIGTYARLIIDARLKRDVIQAAAQLRNDAQNGCRASDLIVTLRALVADLDRKAARTTGERFKLYDAADSWASTPPEFIVQDLLPMVSVVWWGGMPKRFKSLLVLYVCLAIASGGDVIANRFRVLQRPKILFIAREDGEGRIEQRRDEILAAWGVRPTPGALRFLIQPAFDLMNPLDVEWVRDLCRRDDVTLLVLDTWTALSPSSDPLGPKDQAALAAAVVQLAADIGGTVVVVDHSRKNRPEGQVLSSADIFGPPQKWAAAEHVVMLGATDDPRRVEVFIEGKDADTARFFLSVSPRGSGEDKFTYAGSVEQLADDQRAIGDANRQAVFDTLRANPEALGVAELVATLQAAGRKLSRDTVQRHLAALDKAGRVRRTGANRATRYFALDVAPQGPAAVDAAQGVAADV